LTWSVVGAPRQKSKRLSGQDRVAADILALAASLFLAKPTGLDAGGAHDHDDLGSDRSKTMNVIDSNILRSGMRAENRYTLSSSRTNGLIPMPDVAAINA